jgi:cytoskeleton protein RodZ
VVSSASATAITSGAEETTETSADLPVITDNEGQEPTVLSSTAAEQDEPEQTNVVPAAAVPAVSAATTTTPIAASSAVPTEVAVDASVALQLHFTASCWLRVADASGKSLFEGTKNAGDKVNVSGKEPFSLTIGAPRAVSVYFHGQAVDITPTTAVSSATFVFTIELSFVVSIETTSPGTRISAEEYISARSAP